MKEETYYKKLNQVKWGMQWHPNFKNMTQAGYAHRHKELWGKVVEILRSQKKRKGKCLDEIKAGADIEMGEVCRCPDNCRKDCYECYVNFTCYACIWTNKTCDKCPLFYAGNSCMDDDSTFEKLCSAVSDNKYRQAIKLAEEIRDLPWRII